MVMVVLPDSSELWGRKGTPLRPNSRAIPQGLDQRSKMEKVMLKMARRVRDNARGDELNPTKGARRRS